MPRRTGQTAFVMLDQLATANGRFRSTLERTKWHLRVSVKLVEIRVSSPNNRCNTGLAELNAIVSIGNREGRLIEKSQWRLLRNGIGRGPLTMTLSPFSDKGVSQLMCSERSSIDLESRNY